MEDFDFYDDFLIFRENFLAQMDKDFEPLKKVVDVFVKANSKNIKEPEFPYVVKFELPKKFKR